MLPKYRVCYYLYLRAKRWDPESYSFWWVVRRWYSKLHPHCSYNEWVDHALAFIVSTFKHRRSQDDQEF